MENILHYAVAVFLAASVFVAYIERQAAGVRQDDDPQRFWMLMTASVGGLTALIVSALD